jgi:hypothetical protein
LFVYIFIYMDEFTLTLQKLKGELAEADASFKQACTALQDAYHNKNTYAHAKRDIENKMAKIEELMAFNEMCILTKTYCLSSSLLNEELLAIGQGMDKTDYRQYGNYPRYIDLDRLVHEVIGLKQLYTGWTLECVQKGVVYDTMPPKTAYSFTFRTPHGHHMTCG